MTMQGLMMVIEVHVGNDEDSLLMHKHYMTQQKISCICIHVVINNFEILIPCLKKSKMAYNQGVIIDLENLESNRAIKYIHKPLIISNH